MKKLYTICFIAIAYLAVGQNTTYLIENFDYPALDSLTNNGWFAHSAAGTNPILVNDSGLSWNSYIASNIGNAAAVTNTGEDINKPLPSNIDSGAVYTSFLVKINAPFPESGEGFFFHYGFYTNGLTPNAGFSNISTAFRARTHVARGTDPDTQFKLGLSFNTGDPTDVTTDLNIGETYLVVVKYEFIESSNDSVSLFVFAEGDNISSEPATPDLGPMAGTAADALAIQAVALRQYNSNQDVVVDGIVVKNYWGFEECVPVNAIDEITACDSFTWIDGETYMESNNTAEFTITDGAANGCDSIVTLNLTINISTTGTDVVVTCGDFTWIDGNTYNTSTNMPTFNIVGGNANSCDSLVTLDLTIGSATNGTDLISACESYEWIDGNTYTDNNNTATFLIEDGAANGCDSLVTLDLTIIEVNSDITLAVTTAGVGAILSSNSQTGEYQWLDCDDNFAEIDGETGQSFTPTESGNYALQITENGCTEVSECKNVNLVGISDAEFSNTIDVFPNPTNSTFTISWNEMQEVSIKVFNMLGQIVEETPSFFGAAKEIKLQDSGLYLIEITNENNLKSIKKIIKQ